jgi:hypothetical protein
MNEFKKIKNNNETRYVLETMTAGATGAGAIATAEKDIGEVQKRIPDAPKPRNFVAKNAKMGGAGQHKDKKKAEKQGSVKHKKSYMESLRTQIDQLKSKLAEQGVAEGSGANKTHLAMAYLKAVVMAPIGTPEKRRILNWQQILSNQFDIEMDPDTLAQMLPQFDSQLQSGNLDKLQNRMASRGELEIGESEQGVAEAPEDRTSYQVAKILSDRGIKYDPAQENELINAIGMVLVKELNMSPKEARYLISYDEDFVSDTLGELRSMEQSVSEVDVYMESLAHSLQQVLSEKAVSKQQQKFMGMVHAAQKGEKPASKEVAKVAKDMGKKDAKDFASTKHKGLPEKKKSKK